MQQQQQQQQQQQRGSPQAQHQQQGKHSSSSSRANLVGRLLTANSGSTSPAAATADGDPGNVSKQHQENRTNDKMNAARPKDCTIQASSDKQRLWPIGNHDYARGSRGREVLKDAAATVAANKTTVTVEAMNKGIQRNVGGSVGSDDNKGSLATLLAKFPDQQSKHRQPAKRPPPYAEVQRCSRTEFFSYASSDSEADVPPSSSSKRLKTVEDDDDAWCSEVNKAIQDEADQGAATQYFTYASSESEEETSPSSKRSRCTDAAPLPVGTVVRRRIRHKRPPEPHEVEAWQPLKAKNPG